MHVPADPQSGQLGHATATATLRRGKSNTPNLPWLDVPESCQSQGVVTMVKVDLRVRNTAVIACGQGEMRSERLLVFTVPPTRVRK